MADLLEILTEFAVHTAGQLLSPKGNSRAAAGWLEKEMCSRNEYFPGSSFLTNDRLYCRCISRAQI